MRYTHFNAFFKLIKSEVNNAKGIRIKMLILLYRLASYGKFKGGFIYLLSMPVYIFYRLYSEFLLGTELPIEVIAGPGLTIYHPQGLIVHRATKIGARCTLRQGVTIGNKKTKDGVWTGSPVIGDDVEFGANAVVIGNINIGSRVTVGACTVVTKDVPDDHIAVGQGMRLIKKEMG